MVPTDGALTGWAALAWSGVKWVDGIDRYGASMPATIVTPGHYTRARGGIAISHERLLPTERRTDTSVVLTDPLRSTAYEVRYAPNLLEAVRWIDLVAASDLVSIEELTAYAATLTAWTGVEHLREALAHADENVWSPMEVDLRLTWTVRLRLGHVVTNRAIFDLEGRHIGTPDVLDLERGVVGEYDGGVHLAGKQRAKDLVREGAFRRAGLEYVTMIAADRRDPTDFKRRTLEARARALRLPADERLWTIDPPRWWVPTNTVRDRRALTQAQRAHFLRRVA
ncbi:hypothetical protein [Nocardioides albertanoniae]|uniref:hypothetical protein n=1 Tax=Nocardioides albertanoniae TaxID=1175486 RepID=UPI0014769B36|nr:hypothetical protein [Nocardioides albertanoniae]